MHTLAGLSRFRPPRRDITMGTTEIIDDPSRRDPLMDRAPDLFTMSLPDSPPLSSTVGPPSRTQGVIESATKTPDAAYW